MTYAINRQTILRLLGCPFRIALCSTLLHPLLVQATEMPASDIAPTANISSKLVNMRDPRIAGMSISDLLPAKPETRNNTVRYPPFPVAATPSSSWSAPSSGPSPLMTYFGALAASIATGSPYLPGYPTVTAVAPGTFDNRK